VRQDVDLVAAEPDVGARDREPGGADEVQHPRRGMPPTRRRAPPCATTGTDPALASSSTPQF